MTTASTATKASRSTTTMDRRGLLSALAVAPAAMASTPARAAAGQPEAPSGAQTQWSAEPPQHPARSGMAPVPDCNLWYWDTGSSGPPVVLLHAYTGSAASWGYQQPVLAKAGFRVIGYSRRGYLRSEQGPADRPGYGSEDLRALADFLGLKRFHLVGTAAGGFTAVDFAISYPERVISLTLASSLMGIVETDYLATTERLVRKAIDQLPPEFIELGPSYRAAYPAGVERWIELQRAAITDRYVKQMVKNRVTWAALRAIRVPSMIMTGDADLYFPPSRLREVAAHLTCETAIIPEAGHAAFWEQPAIFNRLLGRFLSRSGGG